MNAISGMNAAAAMPTLPTTSTSTGTSHGGDDLLADMNPAMDAAFAVGRPTDASGAAGILATTGSYIKGASATIDKLDAGLERRRKQLTDLQVTDPEAAQRMQTQIDLLERLRDRIQLSIERVSETIAGRGGDDDAPHSKRREELELLEQRRLLLAGTGSAQLAPAPASLVAGAYSAARAN